jgi:predicted amidohydrolase YtcJ
MSAKISTRFPEEPFMSLQLQKLLALVCVSLFAVVANAQQPDHVYFNGKILTVDADFSIVEAVAVSDGRITAVGTNADIRKLAGSETTQIDLEGHTMIPGLIDNHMHYMRGASRWRFEARIDGVTSRKKALEIIGKKAKQAGPGEWVFVLGGWNEQQFSDAPGEFTTAELDAAAPDNPVFIQKSYSRAYMNGLAERELSQGGSTGSGNRSNRQGSSGNSQRSQNRSQNNRSGGTRSQGNRSQSGRGSSSRSGGARAVINRATRFVPARSDAERVEDIAYFNSVLNRHGLTTVYDVGRASDGNFDPVEELSKQGKTTLRVFHSLRYQANNPLEANQAVTLIESSKPRVNDDWFGLIGIGEHTYNPLHDSYMRSSFYGDDVWEQFDKLAIAAAEGGWHIHEHSMQDSTAARILDIAERIDKVHPMEDLRWTIAHCDLISRDSIERAKKLGMTLAVHNKTAKPAMEDRDSPPVAWMQESGIVWGLGSDSTVVSTINPFHSLWWVTSGRVFPNKTSIRTPVSRQAALTAHTRSNAFLMFKEEDLGSLEVGKWADMIVLDRDYMTIPTDEIRDIRPVKTLIGGKTVYDFETDRK